MKRRFPLETVLRVRRVREQVARAEVVRASASLNEATERVLRRQASLLERTLPSEAPIAAFLGAVAATRSMATEVAALAELARIRKQELAVVSMNWTEAEQAKRAIEEMADRHQVAIEHDFQRAAQLELDDLAQRPRQVAAWALDSDEVQP